MRTIEFNIGLSGNPLDVVDTLVEVKALLKLEVLDTKIVEGEYNGEPEETLIILGRTELNTSEVEAVTSVLCAILEQESIALTIDGKGILQYSFLYGEPEETLIILGRTELNTNKSDIQEFNYAFFNTLQVFGKGTRTGGLQNTGVCKPINENFNR